MFKDRISRIENLSGETFNNFFTKIKTSETLRRNYDVTMECTARVLFQNRIPDGCVLRISDTMLSSSDIQSNDYTFSFSLFDNINDAAKDFLAIYQDFSSNTQIKDFLKEICNLYVLQSSNGKHVMVMLERKKAIETYHLIQAFFSRFFPSLFEEKPLIADETSMLAGLTKTNSEKYSLYITKLAKSFDVTEYLRVKTLTGIFQAMEANMKKKVDEEYLKAQKEVEKWAQYYMNACSKLQNAILQKEAVSLRNNSAKEEFISYLNTRKDISLSDYDEYSQNFTLTVHTALNLFDPDLYEHSRDSLIQLLTDRNNKISETSWKRFLNHCFSENADTIVYVQGGYEINLDGGAYPVRIAGGASDWIDYDYNPHLELHRCSGNYASAICSLTRKSDYIGVAEQITASVKSINFAEIAATVVPFLINMVSNNRKCIGLPNGIRVTATEAIAFFDKEENHEEDHVE